MAIKFLNTVAVDTDVLYVDASSNRVGIGTTSPSSLLHLQSASSPALQIKDTTNNVTFKAYAQDSNSHLANTSNHDLFIDTNNTSRITVKSGGNVGIGTTSPAKKLDVNGSANIDGTLFVNATNNHIRLVDSDGTGNFSVGVNTNFQIRDITANTTPLTIKAGTPGNTIVTTSSGNVGIGTGSPSELLHIHSGDSGGTANIAADEILVEGDGDTGITISSPSSNVGTLAFGDENVSLRGALRYDHSDDSMIFRVSSAEKMRITDTGNVGIGTTSPSAKLQISTTMTSSPTSNIFLDVDGTNTTGGGGSIIFGTSASAGSTTSYNAKITGIRVAGGNGGDSQLGFWTTLVSDSVNPQERMTITKEGNVGIGTTNPGTKLHVDSASDFNVALSKRASTTSAIKFTLSDPSVTTNTWKIEHDSSENLQIFGYSADSLLISTNSIERMRVASNGNVGIGTTNPQRKLEVVGKIRVSDEIEWGWGGVRIIGSTTTNDFRIKTWNGSSTQDRLIVDGSGNVGIGTTSPEAKLDVESEILISGTDPILRMERGDGFNSDIIKVESSTDNIIIGDTSLDEMIFEVDTGEAMRINSSGYVSIGTTSPSTVGGIAKMTIDVGTSFNRPVSIINGTTDGMYIRRYSTGGSYQLQTTLSNANSGNLSLQSYGGNVGIGTTSPLSKLHLNGGTNVNLQIGGVGTELQIKTTNDADSAYIPMVLRASEYNILNGNVGIGTTSPNHLLDVESAGASTRIYNLTSDGNTDLYLTTTGTTGASRLLFGDTADNDIGKIIYRNNGDSMAFETNAGERMRITSGGNVGIGITNPNTKLHVGGIVQVTESSNTAFYGGNYVRVFSDQNYAFRNSGGSNIANISMSGNSYFNGGNVGIGTTNPSEKLEVAGNARITGDVTLSNGNALRWTSDDVRIEGTTAGDNIKFYVANTEILQLAQSGTLATVTGNLRVTGAYYDSNNSAGTSGQVLSSTATGTDWVSLSEISGVDGTGTANYVAKWSDTDTITNSLIYDNGTNVGIGTTSPSEKLEVNGRIKVQTSSGSLTIKESGVASAAISGSATVGVEALSNFRVKTGSSLLEHFTVLANGNVGIGTTSPVQKLQVEGNIYTGGSIRIEDTGDQLEFGNANVALQRTANFLELGGYDGIIFRSSNTTLDNQSERMRITSSGNVGINTTSPSYKLDVSGGAKAGGVITYSKSAGSLDTTGYAVAGLTTGSNGNSAGFTFTCFGHGGYQKVVYSCYNVSGTWNTIKVIDEGTNAFDVEASANATTITFTFKTVTGTKSYTPRVTVEATGTSINNTYA